MRSRIESGAALASVLVSILVMVLFAAVAIDIGWLTIAKQELRTAVDAAALTGASAVPSCNGPGVEPNVQTLINQLNQPNEVINQSAGIDGRNVINGGDVEYVSYDPLIGGQPIATNVFADSNGVRVTKTFDVGHFFGGITGLPMSQVTVSATAILGGPGCFRPDLPVAMATSQKSNSGESLCSGNACNLQATTFIANNANVDTGAFFDIVANANAQDCRDYVNGVRQMPVLCVGGMIELNNGTDNSCLRAIGTQLGNRVQTQRAANPPITPEGWEVTIPIIDNSADPTQNLVQSWPVVGFTKIRLTQVQSQGNPKFVNFNILCQRLDRSSAGGMCCNLDAGRPLLVE